MARDRRRSSSSWYRSTDTNVCSIPVQRKSDLLYDHLRPGEARWKVMGAPDRRDGVRRPSGPTRRSGAARGRARYVWSSHTTHQGASGGFRRAINPSSERSPHRFGDPFRRRGTEPGCTPC
jgi:hypothetical protein